MSSRTMSYFGCSDSDDEKKQKAREFLDREAFKTFLLNHPEPMRTNHAFNCPVGCFLIANNLKCGFDPNAPNENTLPEWVMTFGKLVDQEPDQFITSTRALELLESIP